MPTSESSEPADGDLRAKIEKLGKDDRLKLFRDLSLQIDLREDEWARMVPFLIPRDLRKKFLRYPWSLEDRRNLGLMINVPICLQDPSFIRKKSELGIEMIEVRWEPGLTDGPTSARITVEDSYGGIKRPPAKWDEKRHCFVDPQGQPIAAKLNNDQFHQVNVWAIAQRILDFYEDFTVLGRPVPWGFNGNRLIIKPHASTEETEERGTGYDPVTKSLEFAYIHDTVYACLSHDIVAHEIGHAVLDGMRPYFYDSWTVETLAFHEFVADLTAIMSAFRNNYVRNIFVNCLEKGLPEKDFLAEIGEEFGKAALNSDFIRTAQNNFTMENIRDWEKSCPEDAFHKSSQVLTGLIYDLLLELYQGYKKRTKPKHTPNQAAWHVTERVTRMALQPLDFLPPVDVTFDDYVEAFLIRDALLDPEDEHGYRPLFRELCKKRNIQAPEEGKRPSRPGKLANPYVDGLLSSRTSAYTYIHTNREALYIPAKRDVVVDVYDAQKVDQAFARLPREIIVQYLWKEDVLLKGKEFGSLKNKVVPLLCGGTLVFDENSNFLYWVHKPGTEFDFKTRPEEQEKGESRKRALMDYVAACVAKKDKGAIQNLFSGRFITKL